MTDKNKHLIDGVEPKYYARIPNMAIDDLPYAELALYTYYKRVAYDTGSCWQSTATIGKSLKMSPKKVRATRRALEGRGLIAVSERGNGSTKTIKIVNIWQKNIDRYNVPWVQNDPPPGTIVPTPGSNRTHKEKEVITNKENQELAATKSSDGAVLTDVDDDKWIQETWLQNDITLHCNDSTCNGIIAYEGAFYRNSKTDDIFCPGCWVALYSKDVPPTLTELQYDMLKDMEDHGLGNNTVWANKPNPLKTIGELGKMGLCKLLPEANEWVATDTGRAALEAWQQSTMQKSDNAALVQKPTIAEIDDEILVPTLAESSVTVQSADEPPPKAKKKRKARKSKKEVHPLYQEMTQAIKGAFKVNDEHADKSDFSRIGGVANNLLDRGAKPFMIKRFYEWCNTQFDSKTLNYEILKKWYTRWRSEMGDRVPDELPQDAPVKAEEVTTPPTNGKEVTAEDCRRATADLAEKMSMSQFDDENYEDGHDGNSPTSKT